MNLTQSPTGSVIEDRREWTRSCNIIKARHLPKVCTIALLFLRSSQSSKVIPSDVFAIFLPKNQKLQVKWVGATRNTQSKNKSLPDLAGVDLVWSPFLVLLSQGLLLLPFYSHEPFGHAPPLGGNREIIVYVIRQSSGHRNISKVTENDTLSLNILFASSFSRTSAINFSRDSNARLDITPNG